MLLAMTYKPRSRWIHGQFTSPHWNYRNHIVPPVSRSAAYRLESAGRGAEGFRRFANPEFNRHDQSPIYIYDRLDEPCRSMLEDRLAVSEGAEIGVAFATGMAAIAASLSVLLKAGDRLLAHRTLYGCTFSLFTNWFPRYGIETLLLDLNDDAALKEACQEKRVQALFTESLTNPTLDLIDLDRVTQTVQAANQDRKGRRIFTVVDNTFCTPYCLRPLEHGADIVVHSLTKNLGGFGTDMGGVVLGPELLEPDLLLYRKDFGGVLEPRAAWSPLVYGLPTLWVRSRTQVETALMVATFLESHPAIASVVYPGLDSYQNAPLARKTMRNPDGAFAPGTLIYFAMAGTPEEAQERGQRLMDHIAEHAGAITLAVSLGQIRTLIEHPSSMTHATIPIEVQLEAGIEPGGVRLSIGLEDPEDIIKDIAAAIEAID